MKSGAACTYLALALTLPQKAIAAGPADYSVRIEMREGRPVVDGVYVNGHGPYRFLVDTGATLNQIEPKLAQSIGLTETFQTSLRSSTGVTSTSGSEGHELRVGPITADAQVFLFAGMDAIHQLSFDIQGVLGQVFLSRFDYVLDVRARRMAFGRVEPDGKGTRIAFQLVQGRPLVPTNLGLLVLDSGAHLLVRFGVKAVEATYEMVTVSGRTQLGTVFSTLVIQGRTLWRGDAIAVPQPAEADAAGLLPINLFKTVYVCNSEGYVVLN
jgi:hypothetical protein